MIQYCSSCDAQHQMYDDGFDYLSCMGFQKFGMGSSNSSQSQKDGSNSADMDKKPKKSSEVRVEQKIRILDTFRMK